MLRPASSMLTLILFVACTLVFAAEQHRSELGEKTVSGEQLQQLLAGAGGRPDKDVAKLLSEMELRERLSASALSQCEAEAPGPLSRQALIALADVAAFSDLPPSAFPAIAAPDVATQRRILTLTVDYVTKTLHRLPNFLATRTTTSYQAVPWRPKERHLESIIYSQLVPAQPLHLVGKYSATVLYRKGEEAVRGREVRQGSPAPGLTTSGEFGPILGTVMLDAARSNLSWSHWEQGANGPEALAGTPGRVAVFRYSVPTSRSHYQVTFCCKDTMGGVLHLSQEYVGYHGEIAVDAETGTLLRLVLKADLQPPSPIANADILVEYGPVQLGGVTYICPLHGVALSLAPAMRSGLQTDWQWDPDLLQTSLNDVVFEQYRLFRADVKILDGPEP